MKKNNKEISQRGLKRDMKNKARKKRSAELKNFNNLVATFKFMDAYRENMRKQQEELNIKND
jgi:hypothetical protein